MRRFLVPFLRRAKPDESAAPSGARPFLGIAAGRSGYVVIGFTAFLLALLWSAVAYQLDHDKAAVLDGARTNTRTLARAYAEHIVGTLRLLDQMLLRVESEYEKDLVPPDLAQHLHDVTSVDKGSVLVGVTDERGYLIGASLSLPPAARFAGDRSYFLAHASGDTGQLYISEPMKGRIVGKQIIVLSRRLSKPDGALAGVVFVSFDPQYLSGFFSDLAISKDSGFTVIGRDMIVRDMILGSGRATDAIGKSVANSHLVPALARAANGEYEAVGVLGGVERLYAYRSLPDYPLIVLASVARADVLADFRERQAWLIAVAAVLSLIFIGVALFQLRRLTRQLRAEQSLRQTQELLIEAQRVAKFGYVVNDVINDRMYWSDSLFDMRGVPRRGAFTFAEAALFMEPEDRARYFATRLAALAERQGFAIDVRLRRPDGSLCWEHRVVHPHFDARGDLVRVLVVVQDITARKETEIELNRSRENMARAQEIAALGSFESDLVGGKTEWSDEIYRILGVAKGDVVPGHDALLDRVHPEDRAALHTARAAGVAGRAIGTMEFRIIRPDGVERIIRRENALIFDDNGNPVRLCGTLQDITERRDAAARERELERKLMHSQKLEALGTLAGGIAHDLNNTLTPIMALSKLTARRLEPGSTPRANLEIIFAASEQARDLVKRVLAFSRRDKADKLPINLGAAVEEALKLLRATVPTSIELAARIDEVPLIPADASQIHQIVTNLVTNAVQAIGSRMGVITIVLEHLSEPNPQGTIRLSVTDTGEGMDEATRRRIFEPFFTTKQVGQGTGLGLSIIEGIVADHGGRIEVESEPGKGARFDVFFPLTDAEASAAA